MYFHSGYALHGTYWHDNFGQPMSHGCVNLRTADAQWLFNWAGPALPAGASQVQSSSSNPGTRVVVHY
jgi:lipoprotein-anchoring transpeptidase ErfK/SrfK